MMDAGSKINLSFPATDYGNRFWPVVCAKSLFFSKNTFKVLFEITNKDLHFFLK